MRACNTSAAFDLRGSTIPDCLQVRAIGRMILVFAHENGCTVVNTCSIVLNGNSMNEQYVNAAKGVSRVAFNVKRRAASTAQYVGGV